MRFHVLIGLLLTVLAAATARAAAPIELELATTGGLQITAPQQWLQLLASLGIDDVQIRGANAGDEPRLENRGSDARPRYHVVGILAAGEELHLPGGNFRASDRGKLKDYFTRLSADGAEGTIASRGRFGLTEKQLAAVHADLAQPIDFTTKGVPPREILNRLQAKFALHISSDADADRILRDAEPAQDEVRGLTAGTGLAMILRSYGLALRPEKSLGEATVYQIAPVAARIDGGAGRDAGKGEDSWPVGTPSEKSPRELAPVLMEFLNVEIDGYTLAEAVDAMGPRIKIPIYWDHAALATAHIDPNGVKVSIPKTRTYYKRVLDRVLAQGRLAGELRTDEAGTPFLYITR
jgi:hypothetical protein